MVGQLVCVRGKGRDRGERSALGPLPVLRWTVHAPEGLSPRRLARRIRRAERALVRAGVVRVVLGADLPWADQLALLRPADPLPMLRACADVLALGALEAEGVPPNRGRVALSAPRLCPELEQAAQRLCPLVRGLLIDAPGGGDHARYLQARFGLPVAPPSAGADVTVAFGPAGGRWGRCVELYEGGCLGGLTLGAEGIELPPDRACQVLSLLWEQGMIRREKVCCQLLDTPAQML